MRHLASLSAVMAVLDKIAATPVILNPNTGETSLPKTPVVVKKVTVLKQK